MSRHDPGSQEQTEREKRQRSFLPKARDTLGGPSSLTAVAPLPSQLFYPGRGPTIKGQISPAGSTPHLPALACP